MPSPQDKFATKVAPIGNDAATADKVAGAAGAAAAKTYDAVADKCHVISGVAWSYSAAPTGGRLTIEDGAGVVVLDLDITTAGPDSVQFVPPKRGTMNTALIVTLAAPGGAVVGKLNILGHWLE